MDEVSNGEPSCCRQRSGLLRGDWMNKVSNGKPSCDESLSPLLKGTPGGIDNGLYDSVKPKGSQQVPKQLSRVQCYCEVRTVIAY